MVSTQSAKPIVEVRGLVNRFGKQTVHDNLDLDIMPREVLGVVGGSGTGKSVLLRSIVGLRRPNAGSVKVFGQDLQTLSEEQRSLQERRFGVLFQSGALFSSLTVAENIGFGLDMLNRPKSEIKATVAEMLELVQMTPMADRRTSEISGGQQQRVALARALGPQPDVLLLDEPFSNLDAGQRVQVRNEVRAILRMSGTTAIFVTHHQEEALFMGDRVAVQNQGRIEQTGTPDEVFGNPATRFVAEFMGETDFLPGDVTVDGVKTEIGLLQPNNEVSVGAHVDVAVRADDVEISPDPSSDAIVLAREFRGMVNVYRVRLPSGRFIHSMQPHTVQIAPATHVRVIMEPGHELTCFSGSQS